MHDLPTADDLLAAVASFLREQALPQLQGHAAFHARVAANVVDSVRRQLQLQSHSEARELQRLRELLDATGSVAELNELLCRRIRSGELTLRHPGLKEHLWASTLDKLAVDQPGYSTYQRALARRAQAAESD